MRDLLAESISCYRAFLDLYEEFGGMDLGAPEAVLTVHGRLSTLQEEAAAVDARIEALLESEGLSPSAASLAQERLELMAEVQRRNRLLLPRVEAMMASTLAELNEIRTGMAAVAGYRPGPGEKGRRVFDAC